MSKPIFTELKHDTGLIEAEGWPAIRSLINAVSVKAWTPLHQRKSEQPENINFCVNQTT